MPKIRSNPKDNIGIARLHDLLAYDAGVGSLTWKVDKGAVKAGTTAGHMDRAGYRRIRIEGRMYLAHRLAWAMQTGSWPTEEIDHINADPSDNRFVNLRSATRSQNAANKPGPSKSVVGMKGVRPVMTGGNYTARIKVSGRTIYLGVFPTPEMAHRAYAEAARKHFGEFARSEP